MKKRVLSVLMAMCAVFSLLPAPAAAADAEPDFVRFTELSKEASAEAIRAANQNLEDTEPDSAEKREKDTGIPETEDGLPARLMEAEILESGTCGAEDDGSNVSWTLDSDGVLTISGSGAMAEQNTSIDSPWYHSRSGISTVVITDGVTKISNFAFWDCDNLTDYAIADSVTEIGMYAFGGCDNLTSFTIPRNVSVIWSYFLYGCVSLTDVFVEPGNTVFTSVDGVLFSQDMSSLYCYPSAKSGRAYAVPETVTFIFRGAFSRCQNLEQITLPPNITGIFSRTFEYCEALRSIVIPEQVTGIDYLAFNDCVNLENVYLPASLTYISDNAFDDTNVDTIFYGGTEEQWNGLFQDTETVPTFSRCLRYLIKDCGMCGESDSNLMYGLNTLGTLAVSGSGAMEDYYSGSATPWAEYRSEISTVELDGEIRSLRFLRL